MKKDSQTSVRRFSIFPKSLGKTCEPLLKPIYKKHGFAESRILTQWHEIVGTELSRCSIPQKISLRGKDGGILYILVASSRALELQHMQPVILDKIATYFGYAAVKKIRFIQAPLHVFYKGTVRQKHINPQASETLAKVVEECQDEALRKALLALGSRLDSFTSQ